MSQPINITKTCLYNSDSLKPHFYRAKLGFTGVYIIFLILLKNIDRGYHLMSTHNLCFEQKYEKYQNFFIRKFSFFFYCKIFNIFEQQVFVMNVYKILPEE